MNINRRKFIKNAGMALATAYAIPPFLGCNRSLQKTRSPISEIGLQLFTMREQLYSQAQSTIERIAHIGYDHVETFGAEISSGNNVSFWGIPLSELKTVLDTNGLVTYSGHYDISSFLSSEDGSEEALKRHIETAAQLGQRYLIAPIPPMMAVDRLGSDDYRFIADQLNKGGELAAKSGIQIGYHNHFWEFRSLADGSTGLDILIGNTEPDFVVFELDLFWTEKSGIDSTTYFDRYPGRFPLWHIKDMAKNNTDAVVSPEFDQKPVMDILEHITYTEVGEGAIDFKHIMAKAEISELKYAFVEQDIIKIDPFLSIETSLKYVQENLLDQH